jgi:acetyl esterase/lipase
VVVIGHSAGAHLAALAALAPDEFSADCAWPTARADALVGLSGPYDTARIPGVASALLGGDTNPRHAQRADALSWAGHRPEVPVLLVHGRADTVVPTDFTTDFAAALRGSGHEVDVRLLPKADHPDTYRARTVGPLIERWASTIAAAPP